MLAAWGSSRQGRNSSGVEVPTPSITRFGRLAYPMCGEVTNRNMLGRKSHGCPVDRLTHCGRSDLGGEQTQRPEDDQLSAAPRANPYRSRGTESLRVAEPLPSR